MTEKRAKVLSIAGFDPSAGAGILADTKVFELHKVLGMGVCTCITFQNEDQFEGVSWLDISVVKHQLSVLFAHYNFPYVKIGLVQNLEFLEEIIDFLIENQPDIKIIWDPILKASAGYDFHPVIEQEKLVRILNKIYLLIPNLVEMGLLNPGGVSPAVSAKKISKHCSVFLKGGHSDAEVAEDILFMNGNRYVFSRAKILNGEKHGSGCVLSSSISANLAAGYDLVESCRQAKNFTSMFLSSTKGLLGYLNN